MLFASLGAFFRQNVVLILSFFAISALGIAASISADPNGFDAFLDSVRKQGIGAVLAFSALAVFVALAVRFLTFYLEFGSSVLSRKPSGKVGVASALFSIFEAITRIEKRTADQMRGSVTPELFETTEERDRFKDRIADEIKSEVAQRLDDRIVQQLKAQSQFEDAERVQVEIKERLYKVVGALERRANLNLAVGATIGACGVILLVYLLYLAPPTLLHPGDHVLLAVQYFARVSIVLLVEVFAFFFLTLYRQTLGELRHTHNEITNVEMKLSGMQAAIASADKKALAHAINKAIDTERNFVLEKGRTTIELERYRADSANSEATLKVVRDLWFGSVQRAAVEKRVKQV